MNQKIVFINFELKLHDDLIVYLSHFIGNYMYSSKPVKIILSAIALQTFN